MYGCVYTQIYTFFLAKVQLFFFLFYSILFYFYSYSKLRRREEKRREEKSINKREKGGVRSAPPGLDNGRFYQRSHSWVLIKPDSRPRYLVICNRDEIRFFPGHGGP